MSAAAGTVSSFALLQLIAAAMAADNSTALKAEKSLVPELELPSAIEGMGVLSDAVGVIGITVASAFAVSLPLFVSLVFVCAFVFVCRAA